MEKFVEILTDEEYDRISPQLMVFGGSNLPDTVIEENGDVIVSRKYQTVAKNFANFSVEFHLSWLSL